MSSRIKSTDRQSNTSYHRCGKKNWWARIDDDFLKIERVRGDSILDVEIDMPPGTSVHIGVGPRSSRGVRQVVVSEHEEETRCVECEKQIVEHNYDCTKHPNPR